MKAANNKDVDQSKISKPKDSLSSLAFIFILIVIILAVADYGVYVWQHNQVISLSAKQDQLNSKIISTKQQIQAVTNQNNGVVSSTKNKPDSNVSLLNGAVTFKLPSNWVVATASKYAAICNNGAFDSTDFCLDMTVIVPSSLNTNSSKSTYTGIKISVYKNINHATSQNWFDNDWSGGGVNLPASTITSTKTIDGYSTYYQNNSNVSLVYGIPKDERYVLSSQSYVVVIKSEVSDNAAKGTSSYNNYSQYSSVVESLAKSIKIQRS